MSVPVFPIINISDPNASIVNAVSQTLNYNLGAGNGTVVIVCEAVEGTTLSITLQISLLGVVAPEVAQSITIPMTLAQAQTIMSFLNQQLGGLILATGG